VKAVPQGEKKAKFQEVPTEADEEGSDNDDDKDPGADPEPEIPGDDKFQIEKFRLSVIVPYWTRGTVGLKVKQSGKQVYVTVIFSFLILNCIAIVSA
jgi:hypothetical protein